ncbi:MAG: hypothetical protein MZV65_15155 [Chromatiales bacterium]|nr:hypothetical protein [Chromatiales bacterium]
MAWKLAQSPASPVFVAPGNGGTATRGWPASTSAHRRSAELARVRRSDSDIASHRRRPRGAAGGWASSTPSAPPGCRFSARRRPPRSSKAPRISPSSSWRATASPPPRYRHASPMPPQRTPTSTSTGAPIVVKADGLAAGKGVVVAPDRGRSPRRGRRHARAATASARPAHRVVIEEFLRGEEASFIVMVDGEHVLPLASSQDHKRLRRRRPGPQHRRHGRLFARAGGHPGTARAHHARGHRPDRARHGGGRHAATPVSSTPA